MKQRRFLNFNDVLKTVDAGRDRYLLRNFNFMNDGQPPSVKQLAENLGFFVELRKLPYGVDGYLEAEPFAAKGFKIVVNANHTVTRKRWTVLHELAHYFIHPRFRDPLSEPAYRAAVAGSEHFYSSDDEILEEREANEWVQALIFSGKAFDAAWYLHRGDKEKIARIFGVSVKSVEIYLRNRRS